MFADACLQSYRKSSCEWHINIENYSNCNIKSSSSSSHRQWMENTDANTHTDYLGVFLLNDQRSNIITSFLVVFGVCAVTVWKLSREQTNTYNSQPHMMIIQRVWWRICTLPAVLMFIPTLCTGTSAGSSSRSLWCFRIWQTVTWGCIIDRNHNSGGIIQLTL